MNRKNSKKSINNFIETSFEILQQSSLYIIIYYLLNYYLYIILRLVYTYNVLFLGIVVSRTAQCPGPHVDGGGRSIRHDLPVGGHVTAQLTLHHGEVYPGVSSEIDLFLIKCSKSLRHLLIATGVLLNQPISWFDVCGSGNFSIGLCRDRVS